MTVTSIRMAAILLILAVLQGCVLSVNPIISESDLEFDQQLLGSWEEVSGSDRAVISRIDSNKYGIVYTSDNKTGRFEARLGRLAEHRVLDVWPATVKAGHTSLQGNLLIAGHLLLVLDIGPNEIGVAQLDADAMLAALRSGEVHLSFGESESQIILNDSTKDLRSALSTFLADPKALSDSTTWRRAFPAEHPVPAPCFEASAWREADQIFRRDPYWVGADGAYSIDLGNDRTLWLFGDTLIDPSGQHSRKKNVRMIRNSVAIQTGSNPSTAAIKYYWRTDADNSAEDFFAGQNDRWFWPGHGVRLGGHLLLFLNRVRATNSGLGFASDGWNAVIISNPDDEPSEWKLTMLDTPPSQYGIIVGFASVLKLGNHIYAFGSQDPIKSHPIFVARWPLEKVREGDLMSPEWWAGASVGWVEDASSLARWPLFENGQSELTIHADEATKSFLGVQITGFGPADVSMRAAPNLTGPWSKPRMIYRPSEYYRENVSIYAGKAHPHLTGADLILTYATNTFDFAEIRTDDMIYYPRFVRLTRCE